MKEKPPTPPADPPEQSLVKDDDGLTFALSKVLLALLPQGGRSPAAPSQIIEWSRGFADGLAGMRAARNAFESAEGAFAHICGTYLLQLVGHQAWEVLDLDGLEDLCRYHLRIGLSTGYRLMIFARVTTRETAPLGVRKCIAGYEIARRLGLGGIAALMPDGRGWKEPPEWAERLGEPVDYLGSTGVRLEGLLWRLQHPALPASARVGKVRALVLLRREVIARVARRHPVLETTLRARSFAHGGKASITHEKPSTPEEFAALAALYTALKE